MNRIRLLFLVALLAVAAFAIVPAMAQGGEAGPVGRWGVRVGGQTGRSILIDTTTGRTWMLNPDPRRREQWSWREIKPLE
jgi:hypothetical protein